MGVVFHRSMDFCSYTQQQHDRSVDTVVVADADAAVDAAAADPDDDTAADTVLDCMGRIHHDCRW